MSDVYSAGPSEKQNSQPVEPESQSRTDGERLTSELRDIIRSFMQKVQTNTTSWQILPFALCYVFYSLKILLEILKTVVLSHTFSFSRNY